jgi:hypothetical protein
VWGPAAPVRKEEDEIIFNLGMVKLGGALTGEGGWYGGGARTKSNVRERPLVAGGGGMGVEAVGRGAALGVDEAGSVMRERTRGVGRVFERARSAARQRGKKEKRGGSGRGGATQHGGSVGPGPDRVLADCDPGTARAGGASLFGQRRAGR